MSLAVVLARPEIPEEKAGALADALVEATGMLRIDALNRVKRVAGIVIENADPATARHLAELVNEVGLLAGVAPTNAYSRYGRRHAIHRAECTPAGLRSDQEGFVRWDAISRGSVTLYREPEHVEVVPEQRNPMGGIAIGLSGFGVIWAPFIVPGPRKLKQARTRILRGEHRLAGEGTYILDLFLETPPVTLRIDARRFHYGYLGDRMHDRCELNFHLLLADIVQGAQKAVFAPAVGRLLEGDLLLDSAVTDLKAFDLFNRWFLLAAAEDFPDTPA